MIAILLQNVIDNKIYGTSQFIWEWEISLSLKVIIKSLNFMQPNWKSKEKNSKKWEQENIEKNQSENFIIIILTIPQSNIEIC